MDRGRNASRQITHGWSSNNGASWFLECSSSRHALNVCEVATLLNLLSSSFLLDSFLSAGSSPNMAASTVQLTSIKISSCTFSFARELIKTHKIKIKIKSNKLAKNICHEACISEYFNVLIKASVDELIETKLE